MATDGASHGSDGTADRADASRNDADELARLCAEVERLSAELAACREDASTARAAQSTTAELLRIVSDGPSDLDQVLARIAEEAARLDGVDDVIIWRAENDLMWPVATTAPSSAPSDWPRRHVAYHRDSVVGRAIIDGRTVHVDDLVAASEEYPTGAAPWTPATGFARF